MDGIDRCLAGVVDAAETCVRVSIICGLAFLKAMIKMINNRNPLMVNTSRTGGFARWLLLMLLCLGLSDAVKAVAFVGVTSKVPHTGSQFGAHRETVEDFRVKVLGGTVRVTRTWEGEDKQWYINRRWAPLVVEYQIGSCVVSGSNRVFAIGGGGGGGGGAGSVGGGGSSTGSGSNVLETCSIKRGAVNFHGGGQAITAVVSHPANHTQIRIQARDAAGKVTQARWENRQGDWIDYAVHASGGLLPTRYGDRNDIQVTLQYATDGKLTGVLDQHGTQVLWYEYNGAGQVSAVRDYSNRRVEYTYNSQLTSVKDVRGHSWLYTYDSSNTLKTKTDPEGRTTTLSYGPNGVLASSLDQDGVGKSYQYEYDKTKREYYKQEKSSSGRIKETWYDREGDIIRRDVGGRTVSTIAKDKRDEIVTDGAGNKTRREMDQWDNITKILYPDNSTETTTYDPVYSNILEEINANGVITRYAYDAKGNRTKMTEAAGLPEQRITTYTYDTFGQRLTTTRQSDAVSVQVTTSSTYDNYGNELTQTDGEGYKTTYTYDVMSNVLTRKDPRNKIWTNTYDASGNLTSESDPLNHATAYQYDKVNNRTRITEANGAVTQFAYDGRNRVIEVTDALNHKTKTRYDDDGNLIQSIDAAGHVASVTYDLEGRLSQTTDGNGNTIIYQYVANSTTGAGQVSKIIYPTYTNKYYYDKLSRVVRETDVLSGSLKHTTLRVFDKKGNVTKSTDAEGRVTQSVYDAYDRLIRVTDALSGVTHYTYDNRDNLITATDPQTSTTTFTYDKNDQQLTEVRPQGGVLTSTYDSAGNLVDQIDANGRKQSYLVDDANQIVAVNVYSSAGDTNPVKVTSYSFDLVNNLTGFDDGTTSVIYQYDLLNQVTQVTTDFGGFSKTIGYSYSPTGLKATFTSPDGVVVTYSYDAADQLIALQIPNEGALTVNQYQWTQPTQVTLPGGHKQSYSYDPLQRVTQILAKDSANNTLMDFQYAYDKTSNITQKQTEYGAHTYVYDALDRLTQTDNPTLTDEAYTYDKVGNRLTDSRQPGSLGYNTDHQLTGIGADTFQYDASGNLIKKVLGGQTTDYYYNNENRLSEVKQDANTIARYVYDPFGRRIKKEVGGQITYFLYTTEGLVAEYDGTGNEIRQYGYQPDGTWGTDPLYLKTNGQYYYYQNDHLGTPQKLFAKSGAIVWSAKAYAFGETSIDPGSSIENPLRFPGQYFDQETGLHYNYFRYYDPGMGRYVTEDPLGLKADLNIYAYVHSNPIRYSDIYGLFYGGGGGCWGGPGCYFVEGPFGPVCGPEGSKIARWIPDINEEGCKNHDKCYDECASNCEGKNCKLKCDNELGGLYGRITKVAGGPVYEKLKEEFNCDDEPCS